MFHRNVRQDGYTDYNAKVLCAFQTGVENSPTADYSALRATLLWARCLGNVRLSPVGVYAHYEELARGYLYSD